MLVFRCVRVRGRGRWGKTWGCKRDRYLGRELDEQVVGGVDRQVVGAGARGTGRGSKAGDK